MVEQLPTAQLPSSKVFDPWTVLWSGALVRSLAVVLCIKKLRYLDPSRCRVSRLPYWGGSLSVYSATSPLSNFFLVSGNHKLIQKVGT